MRSFFSRADEADADGYVYDGFVSYSQAVSGELATTLQRWLQGFATPWYAPRRLRIFRDYTNLHASNSLPLSIEQALVGARWFILLASAGAAASKWVEDEVAWWREHRGDKNVIIVLTSGRLVWDDQAGDWGAETDALPPSARGMFASQPLWVDLRSVTSTKDLDRSNVDLLNKVAQIAAPLRGVDKDSIVGEHISLHRRARRQRRGGVAGLAMMLVAAVISATLAVNRAAEARAERDTAVSRQLTAQGAALQDTQPNLTRQLSVLGYRVKATTDAIGSLISTAGVPGSFVVPDDAKELAHAPTLAFRGDGDLLAAGANAEVVLQDLDRGRTASVIRGSNGYFTALAMSPDGKTLAGGDGFGDMGASTLPGKISLWDISSPDKPVLLRKLTGHSLGIVSLSFDAGGKKLLSAGVDGSVLLWNTESLETQPPSPARLRASGTLIDGAQISADGRAALVTDQEGGVRVWDLSDPARPVKGELLDGGPKSVASFAPSGAALAVADAKGTITLWDAEDPLHLRRGDEYTLEGARTSSLAYAGSETLLAVGADDTVHVLDLSAATAGEVASFAGKGSQLAVDATGRHMAMSNSNGTVRIWDITDPVLHQTAVLLHGPSSDVNDEVVTAPDGKAALTFGAQSTSLWQLDGERRPKPHPLLLDSRQAHLESAAFSVRDHLLAGRTGASIDVWDVRQATKARELTSLSTSVEPTGDLVFRPRSSELLVAADRGTVLRWDLSDPAHPRTLRPLRTGRASKLGELTISADGNTVVSRGSDDHAAYKWALPSGDSGTAKREQLRLPRTTDSNPDATLSPDGRMAATVTPDNDVRIWDVSSDAASRPVATFAHPSGMVSGLHFSPDGSRLAIGDATGGVGLWDVSDPSNAVALASFDANETGPQGFSPDGKRLALGERNGDTALVDLDSEVLIRRLCQGIGSVITQDQWAQYRGDVPYAPPCP
ncbi:WD40 repeat domain-containing protein [Streptomyces olivochromogenes]|uniref:WD40 repeat domain-containing protein n=1 Tax=Streptomyces olivochromogenes TaxID=1963 RepID=UPI0036D980C2